MKRTQLHLVTRLFIRMQNLYIQYRVIHDTELFSFLMPMN